ncbi:hypothetical protein J3E72DRAFT_30777 [Bipolaris maydis]|nr:hypothetical protein J3E74DRAFT_3804 [Bipolaris maydis]KAJ6200926.1 hypothetical protein J3E72DRAFT_30777 [Bipolaris maydis]
MLLRPVFPDYFPLSDHFLACLLLPLFFLPFQGVRGFLYFQGAYEHFIFDVLCFEGLDWREAFFLGTMLQLR